MTPVEHVAHSILNVPAAAKRAAAADMRRETDRAETRRRTERMLDRDAVTKTDPAADRPDAGHPGRGDEPHIDIRA